MGAYSLQSMDTFSVLCGLRWEHYNNAFNLTNQPQLDPSSGEYHIKTNRFIPLIGVQYAQPMDGGNLTLRVSGFPWLFGYTKYGLSELEFVSLTHMAQADGGAISKGQFLECFLEYRKSVAELGNLGLFVKWNHIRSEIDNVDARVALLIGGILPATVTDTVDVVFQQNHWTFGSSYSLDLRLF